MNGTHDDDSSTISERTTLWMCDGFKPILLQILWINLEKNSKYYSSSIDDDFKIHIFLLSSPIYTYYACIQKIHVTFWKTKINPGALFLLLQKR